MTDQLPTPAAERAEAVNRRMLLRGGAVLAGAAGVSVVGAIAPAPAAADDNQGALLGRVNTASSSTTVQMGGAAASPTLILQKTHSGPQLRLVPADAVGDLARGDIQLTQNGLVVGLSDGTPGGVVNDYLATGFDLDQIAVPNPVGPRRLIDSRNAPNRTGVVATSSADAFDVRGRLTAGSWMDLLIGTTEDDPVEAAFLNITVTEPLKAGHIVVYPSGPKPYTSAVNFGVGQTIANSAFVGTGLVNGNAYCVRVYTSATTQVLVDLTGTTVLGPYGQSTSPPAAAPKRVARRSPARRVVRGRARTTR